MLLLLPCNIFDFRRVLGVHLPASELRWISRFVDHLLNFDFLADISEMQLALITRLLNFSWPQVGTHSIIY